jgi:glutamine amidotransferase
VSDVVVIDSGGANLASLRHALTRLGVAATVTRDPALIGAAQRVLLPGVGAAADAMARLETAGLIATIKEIRAPLLGICLGMQLLFDHSAEGDTACLGLLRGRVEPLPATPQLPAPHMGWNPIQATAPDSLLAGLEEHYFYFVHGYGVRPAAATTATVEYGGAWTAVVRAGNVHGVQFHPERSGAAGARLLENFLQCV